MYHSLLVGIDHCVCVCACVCVSLQNTSSVWLLTCLYTDATPLKVNTSYQGEKDYVCIYLLKAYSPINRTEGHLRAFHKLKSRTS